MANIYQVQSDGNAQKNLQAGDYVKTAGGTYKILDSNQYAGLNADTLKSMGVNYNPTNGYYSQKVGDVNVSIPQSGSATFNSGGNQPYFNLTNQLKYQDTSQLDSWKQQYLNQQLAGLQKNYNNNLQNLANSFTNSYANQYNQIGDVNRDYEKNLNALYNNTYYNNALAVQNAAERGLSSSAQGMAMSTAGLVNASNQASQLASDKDSTISKIKTELNRLASNYSINKDTLSANYSADKLNAMSTAELTYLEKALEIANRNNEIYNSAVLEQNKYKYDYDSTNNKYYNDRLNAQITNDFNASEAQKDRDLQLQLAQMSAANRYSGGYGGYSGGYSGSSGSSDSKNYSNSNSGLYEYVDQVASTGKYTDSTIEQLYNLYEQNPNMSAAKASEWLLKNGVLTDFGKQIGQGTANANPTGISENWKNTSSSSKTNLNSITGKQKTDLNVLAQKYYKKNYDNLSASQKFVIRGLEINNRVFG